MMKNKIEAIIRDKQLALQKTNKTIPIENFLRLCLGCTNVD
jgi:hypothetical protein